jgi:hypothetical protein
MMKHWTTQRRREFLAHCVLFGLPFTLSLAASIWFWVQHSGSLLAGVAVVLVVEVVILAVFILHLAGIRTTIAWARHGLPVLSSVGMVECFYRVFAPHNPPMIALGIAVGLSLLLMGYLFFTKKGIERAVADDALTPEGALVARLHEAQQAWVVTAIDRLDVAQQPLLLPRVASYPSPVFVHERETTDLASEHIADETEPAADRTCKYCGTSNLTMSQVMEHGRRHKKHGTCE